MTKPNPDSDSKDHNEDSVTAYEKDGIVYSANPDSLSQELRQKITDVCVKNGGATLPMINKLEDLFGLEISKELEYIGHQAVITGYPKIIQERKAYWKEQ